jgi:hypothetical protein
MRRRMNTSKMAQNDEVFQYAREDNEKANDNRKQFCFT